MGKSKAAKAQVPECRYAAACTRKDCIFRHPPKKEQQKQPKQPTTDKVCFAFVAGRCAFGKLCHDKHPDESSCITIRGRYAKIDCQWGRGCRTEGCLYRHPSDEPVGPSMLQEAPRAQPAVYAGGPTIPSQSQGESAVKRVPVAGRVELVQIPRAISQAADLRDSSACDIADPLERFLAVNARNTGTQSAAILDLHMQPCSTCWPVLEDVLPERLRMFQQGVWVMTGANVTSQRGLTMRPTAGSLFDTVREYLVRHRYDFAVGLDAEGVHSAFLVRGRRKRQDPIEGVRAVLLCGLPGSGKTMLAEGLARKSGGRFVRVSQEELQGASSLDDAFRKVTAEATSAADEARERAKSGSWWWDHAFSAEKYYLALCFRSATLANLSQCVGAPLPQAEYFHAVLAYQPTALDLRRLLGRPHRVQFRTHLVLEATLADHVGEMVEAIMCAVHPLDGDIRPSAVHIAPTAPAWAARHLQVLNAVPLDKLILNNSVLGSFKVRRALDLSRVTDRVALCLLVHKAGSERNKPAAVSFDAACLSEPQGKVTGGGTGEWSDAADAAIGSLNQLVVLEDVRGASEHEWSYAVANRCARLGLAAPEVKVSRPAGSTESKMEQWTRLRPSCLLHCAAEEVDVAQLLRCGCAALRRNGRVALPVLPEAQILPPVAVLDRSNSSFLERTRWVGLAGLQMNQVIALHLDVPEAECVARLALRESSNGSRISQHQVLAALRPQAEQFEAPAEREGFRAIVRLKGGAPAAQELIRRWTEDTPPPAESDDGGAESRRSATTGAVAAEQRIAGTVAAEVIPEEEIAAQLELQPPPQALLSQWIEGHCPVGSPVDLPPGLPGGLLRDRSTPSQQPRGRADCSSRLADAAPSGGATGSRASAARGPGCDAGGSWRAPGRGSAEMQDSGPPGLQGRLAWHPMEPQASMCGTQPDLELHSEPPPRPPPTRDEEQDREAAEECARQEQLAATLRCMGFDEEPSLNAAQRAGGNLNVAIESVLRNMSGAG